jgi:hypothetical protein
MLITFNMLMKKERMSGHKPSQLLAPMMEFCPAGMGETFHGGNFPFHDYFFNA